MKKMLSKVPNMPIAAKCSVAYAFASLLTKGMNLLTTPIFTRIMSSEQIGIVTTYTSWQTILSVFATLALTSGSFNMAMVDYPDRRDRYMSSILGLSTCASLICLILYLIFDNFVLEFLNLSNSQMLVMLISFIITPATEYWLCRQRYEFKYKKVLLVSTLQTILSTILTLFVVDAAYQKEIVNLGEIRIIASCIMPVILGAYFYIIIIKTGRVIFDKEFWLFSLKINLPLMVHTLAKHIFDVSDRVMIAQMIGQSEVGIYGTLYSFSSLTAIIWSAINASLIPIVFEKIKAGKAKELEKIITPILGIYSILTLVLVLFSPEIIRLMATEEYYSAIYMMPPVAAGIYLTALYNIYSNILLYKKKTLWIMLSTVIASTINILLNLIFLPRYGFIAAAYTTLASYILLATLIFIFCKISFRIKFCSDKKNILFSVATILFSLACNYLYSHLVVRYSIIAIMLLALLVFRKKIFGCMGIIFNRGRVNE